MKSEVMWISILCSVLIVGCVSTTSGCDTPDDDDDMAPGEGYEIGDTVPNCVLTNQDGNTAEVHDAAGDVILLVISAGWCVPCGEAADEAQALSDELNGEFDFTLYETLIQDESYSEDVSTGTLQDWKDDHGLTGLDVWTDGTEDCLDPFGAVELPTFVLIGGDLVIQDIVTNYNATIEAQIADALRGL